MPDPKEILNRLSPGKFDAERAARFDVAAARGALESFVEARDMSLDRESRTVTLALATDQPIEHWFGMLELDVSKKAVVLDRVNNGVAPLLVNHDRSLHPGVLIANSVELGPVIRCQAKFSRSQFGEDMMNDVEDEIRVGTSVGFLVHDIELKNEKEVQKGAIPMYRATKWEILEVSLASIPADIECGVGRSFEKAAEEPEQILDDPESRANSHKTENKMKDKDGNEIPGTDPVVEARTAAQIVKDEIRDTAAALGKPELEHAFFQKRLLDEIAGEPTVAEFKAFARTQITAPAVRIPGEDPAAIAARSGVKTELARVLPRFGKITAFQGERAAEKAFGFGNWVLGRALFDANSPACVAARAWCDKNLTRAMSEGTNEAGGFLVPEEWSNDLIDLREQYSVARRIAKIVPMMSDTKLIPVRSAGLTTYFPGEAGSITPSDMTWGQVSLVAVKLAALARYSSEVNEDSMIDFANTLADELAYAFSKTEDECFFNGDGSGTYGGMTGARAALRAVDATIANIKGLKVGTGNAYSELVLADFRGTVALLPQYADGPNTRWVVSRSFYWNVMVAALLAGGGVTAMEIEDARREKFLGYPVEFSQVMPTTEANSQICALLGDFNQGSILGVRRDVTVAISEHSRFANDQIEIRGTERIDVAVHGVGDTTNAGPIVGLITAAS